LESVDGSCPRWLPASRMTRSTSSQDGPIETCAAATMAAQSAGDVPSRTPSRASPSQSNASPCASCKLSSSVAPGAPGLSWIGIGYDQAPRTLGSSREAEGRSQPRSITCHDYIGARNVCLARAHELRGRTGKEATAVNLGGHCARITPNVRRHEVDREGAPRQ